MRQPDVAFEDLALRFMDIRKRIYQVPEARAEGAVRRGPDDLGHRVGGDAVRGGDRRDDRASSIPIADYELTPTMAIIDANLVMDMPKSLTAAGGIDAVTHALEAYVSVLANEYTDGQALQALKLLKDYLPAAYLTAPWTRRRASRCIAPRRSPASRSPMRFSGSATRWRTSSAPSSICRMASPTRC